MPPASVTNARRVLLSVTIAITTAVVAQDFLGPWVAFAPVKAFPAWLLCARLLLAVPFREARLIVIGLLLGSVGDAVLGFSNFFARQQLFLAGLVCFLLGRLCYTAAFLRQRRARKDRLPWAALILLLGGSLVADVTPGLGPMRVPVLAYAVVITLMALAATFRASDQKMVMSGALVFMVSDGLIAIQVFAHKVPLYHLWAFSTYVLAQSLISEGWARDVAAAHVAAALRNRNPLPERFHSW